MRNQWKIKIWDMAKTVRLKNLHNIADQLLEWKNFWKIRIMDRPYKTRKEWIKEASINTITNRNVSLLLLQRIHACTSINRNLKQNNNLIMRHNLHSIHTLNWLMIRLYQIVHYFLRIKTIESAKITHKLVSKFSFAWYF